MNKNIFQITIGVDIAKKKFDVACLIGDKYKHKYFTNDISGYTKFVIWFIALCADVNPLICMEATGSYSLPLADFLINQGYAVSVVNPAKIHAFGKSELSRRPMPSLLPVTPFLRNHRSGCHLPLLFANYRLRHAVLSIFWKCSKWSVTV